MMVKPRTTRNSGAGPTGLESRKVLQIARRVAATIGTDFLQAIAKHLTRALDADCVVIGEFVSGQMEAVQTVGAYMDGQPFSFEYELAGSASAMLAFGKEVHVRGGAQTRYPSDKLIATVKAQSFLGVPLLDPQGRALGLMMALYRRPPVSFGLAKQILHTFSGRAAAELNRKHEADELRQSEQRYRAFIATNPDAMWRIEFEHPIETSLSIQDQLAEIYRYGYLAECNDAMAALLGLQKAEQVIGFRLEDIAPRSDPTIHEAALMSIRNGYEITKIEFTRIDGLGNRRYFLRSQWGIVEDGKLERVWGTTRDISDLRKSEQARDASEKRISDLLERLKFVVVVQDADGAVRYCNRYLYRKTGWKPSAVTGRRWVDLMFAPEEHAKLLALFEGAQMKPKAPVHFEAALVGPKDQKWQCGWDRTALFDAEGRIVGWANVGRDITSDKALEAQLRQSHKLAMIGKLAGGVAHDFNNLLTVILGYSVRLLEDRNRLDSGAATGLEEIRKAANKGAELTHRLLAFSRRQVLRPEIVNLNALVADAEDMLRRLIGDDIRLTTILDGSIGPVRIDAASFHQILMNLSVNARDAMPDGGCLAIETANATIGESETSPIHPGEYVLLTVSDTGIGMTDEVRDHLFEPFFTTKDEGKGTGLGLSMVYGIVRQSGGAILVDTQPGKGATFYIYFPRVQAKTEQVQETSTGPAHVGGSETILLVEDRSDVRELTASTLRELGYTVLEADSAARALELCQDRARTIHLLMTDVSMPGMTGIELADRVRTYQHGIKVLLMSGYTDPSRLSQQLSLPGCVYLQKPFTPQSLAAAARDLLDRS